MKNLTEEEIYKIAEHNVRVRNRSGLIAFFGVFLFLILFLYAILNEKVWPVFIIVPELAFTFWFIFHQEKKIIGKKTAVDIEVEKLKAAGFETKDEKPLELKEIIKEYKEEDLV